MKREEFISWTLTCDRDDVQMEISERLDMVIQQAIAEHEAKMFPSASEYDIKNGWTLDYDFIKKVSQRASDWINRDGYDYRINYEETEAVLIAFRDKELPKPNKEGGEE